MSTQLMKVENTAFLIEKLASDCSPYQYVRELTKNAIEAIQERQKTDKSEPGTVTWDADWAYLELSGKYKLQISDNGTGMTGAQMESYINSLSSSGRIQSMTENFGMGAKITAGVENPIGLIYKSWVSGHGEYCTLWKDPERLAYGLKQISLPSGDFGHHAPISDAAKPKNINKFGTAVVLLGKSEDEHTMKPEGMPLKWLIKYLNTKFYKLPEEVTIKVRDFSRSDPANWPTSPDTGMTGGGGSQERIIKGMHSHLLSKALSHGSKVLSDATIHWYILPDEKIEQSDIWECTAHIGAVFQDELYEMRTGRNSLGRIREFGLVFGSDRVVIYAEPNSEKLDVAANIARSGLLVRGEELPWAKWASEFRADLPQELRELMDQIVSSSETRDHRDAIKRRLREIKDLMRITRYKRSANGKLIIAGSLPGGDESIPDGSTRNRTTSSRSGTGGAAGDIYGAFIATEGVQGTEVVDRNNEPEVKWVSILENTRSTGDDLEDRAAIYIPESNMIQANSDFRVFQDMIREVGSRYADSPEITAQIKDTVEEWFEQQLIEAILGVQNLQGSPAWDTQTLEKAMSAEALTTAVMPRYNTYRMITRSLGARLGAAASTGNSQE
jgi:hypothetical protein